MKHIHLTRVFAILAVVGVVCSATRLARADTEAAMYAVTLKSGATVTLSTQHTTCADNMLDATFVSPKVPLTHGCWAPINPHQVLVLWDDGEVVAYSAAMFSAVKSA